MSEEGEANMAHATALTNGQTGIANESHSESVLRRLGLSFRRSRIRLDAIDWEGSVRIQARRERLDQDIVTTYAEARLRGDVFPPIILCEVPDRNLLLCPAGMHRIASARAVGESDIDALVIAGATASQVERIAIEDNLVHGKPIDITDRLWLAERLMSRTGMSQAAAAERLRLPEGRLRSFLRSRATEDRLRRMGLQPISSKDLLDRLASVKSDPVFHAIASLPGRYIAAAAISDLVTEINRAPSEAQQLACVASYLERRKSEERADVPAELGQRKPTTYANLTRLANASVGWPDGDRVSREVPAELQPLLRKRLIAALHRLENVIEGLRP